MHSVFLWVLCNPTVPPTNISLTSSPPVTEVDFQAGVHANILTPVTISCVVGLALDAVNYTWYHNDTQLSLPLTQTVLTVNTSSLSAAGTYRCVVSHSNVEVPSPNFTLPNSGQAQLTLFLTGISPLYESIKISCMCGQQNTRSIYCYPHIAAVAFYYDFHTQS